MKWVYDEDGSLMEYSEANARRRCWHGVALVLCAKCEEATDRRCEHFDQMSGARCVKHEAHVTSFTARVIEHAYEGVETMRRERCNYENEGRCTKGEGHHGDHAVPCLTMSGCLRARGHTGSCYGALSSTPKVERCTAKSMRGYQCENAAHGDENMHVFRSPPVTTEKCDYNLGGQKPCVRIKGHGGDHFIPVRTNVPLGGVATEGNAIANGVPCVRIKGHGGGNVIANGVPEEMTKEKLNALLDRMRTTEIEAQLKNKRAEVEPTGYWDPESLPDYYG